MSEYSAAWSLLDLGVLGRGPWICHWFNKHHYISHNVLSIGLPSLYNEIMTLTFLSYKLSHGEHYFYKAT